MSVCLYSFSLRPPHHRQKQARGQCPVGSTGSASPNACAISASDAGRAAERFSSFWTPNLYSGKHDAVLLDSLVERAARDPEPRGRAIHVPALLLQGLLDEPPLGLTERQVGKGAFRGGALPQVESEVSGLELAPGRQQGRPLEHVAQLADIPRPTVRLETPDSPRRELERGASELGGTSVKEMFREDRNVFDPLSQRRQTQQNRADTEVEIAPEALLLDRGGQILMGRRDEPDVHLTIVHVSQTPEAPFFQDLEQLGLDLKVHVSDLVEKQRAAVRAPQQSDLSRDGSRERPSFVAEELGLEELAVQARAIEIQKAFLATGAVAMEPGGQDSLARPGLAADENGPVCCQHSSGLLGQGADRRALAEKGIQRFPRPDRLVAPPPAPVTLILQGALKNEKEGRPVHRFHQELLGPFFQSFHGHAERGVVREDYAGSARIGRLDELEKIEGAAVGKPATRDDGVRPRSPEAFPGRPAGLRLLDLVTVRSQNRLKAQADIGIVIDEEDPLPELGNGTPSSAPRLVPVLVDVFPGNVVLGDLPGPDGALVRVGGVLDTADDNRLEGLPLFHQLFDALRVGQLFSREPLGVSGLAAGFEPEPSLLQLVHDVEALIAPDASLGSERPLARRRLAAVRLLSRCGRTLSPALFRGGDLPLADRLAAALALRRARGRPLRRGLLPARAPLFSGDSLLHHAGSLQPREGRGSARRGVRPGRRPPAPSGAAGRRWRRRGFRLDARQRGFDRAGGGASGSGECSRGWRSPESRA